MTEILPTSYRIAAAYLNSHVGRGYWAASELPPEFNRRIFAGLRIRKIIKVCPGVRVESNKYKGRTWLLTDYGIKVAEKYVSTDGKPTHDTYIEYGIVTE